ncbi:aminoglycoside phosphotransferase family protein [Paenibacillus sp. H1-7]|uniref:phosphotransferase family protein n=1 Tax=Paenibacillus sp. H1-7 TaxID=2282849 RepID=UPI001EF85C57|nr:aminoglycoside phosphotransferase family protein [Paenibacillus sp. H1-7]ULL17155.1 aminoglycoside phosphotransferase family protein [Paenibacillus sp. H1-7]
MDPIRLDELPSEIIEYAGTITSLTFPRQGYTSDVAIIEGSRGRFVVKRSKVEPYSSWLSQEVHVLNGLRSTELPIPEVYRFAEQKNEKQVWALLPFFEGETLRQTLMKERNTDKKHEIIYHFGAVLSTVHSTPCPDALISSDSVWLEDMLSKAEYNLTHYSVDGTAELLVMLKMKKPLPTCQTLIHGDFTIDNVLVNNGKITSIIDWSGGGYGDPRYDLSLAIRPKPSAFEVQSEIDAFFEGYGKKSLTEQEYSYFAEGLYEFF